LKKHTPHAVPIPNQTPANPKFPLKATNNATGKKINIRKINKKNVPGYPTIIHAKTFPYLILNQKKNKNVE
jgi:hypothetical protein